MTDVLTPQQRSYCMSRIQGKDTKPEMMVRRVLHALGYRYRVHVRSLSGIPDVVLSGRKKIIFVHGCFWHRHNCRYGRVIPATRRRFWAKKLTENRIRDRRNRRELRADGWQVLVVWECQTRRMEWLAWRIVMFLERAPRVC